MKVFKVITFKGKNHHDPEKVYTATDQKDANEMFDHWYGEASQGDTVAVVSLDGNREAAVRIKIKGG